MNCSWLWSLRRGSLSQSLQAAFRACKDWETDFPVHISRKKCSPADLLSSPNVKGKPGVRAELLAKGALLGQEVGRECAERH